MKITFTAPDRHSLRVDATCDKCGFAWQAADVCTRKPRSQYPAAYDEQTKQQLADEASQEHDKRGCV